MNEQKDKGKVIGLTFPEHLKGGVYCNNMVVLHTREEFIMDFMLVAPPGGVITARVIMSPGHIKRMVSALKTNIERYEKNINKITEAPEPTKGQVGFHKA